MKLYYFAHRYGGDPMNRLRARERFDLLHGEYADAGIVLWAPWLALAESCIDEKLAWHIIEVCVRASDGVVLDLDGTDEPTPGMVKERDISLAVGGKVEVVR